MGEGLFSFWSFTILLGACHGYFLFVILITHTLNRTANRLLALLILCFSLHLTEYAIAISGLYQRFPHLVSATYPLLFLIGPLFYFYANALLGNRASVSVKEGLHFFPALLCVLLFLPFYSKTGAEKIALLHTLNHESGVEIPLGQFVFMFAHMFQTWIYVAISWRYIKGKEYEFRNYSSSTMLVNVSWLKKLSFGFMLFLSFYVVVLVLLLFVKAYRVEMDYAVVLCVALLIHGIGYVAVKQPQIFNALSKTIERSKKRIDAEVNSGTSNGLAEQLTRYLRDQKPFLNEELRIVDVAEAMQVSSHDLSKVINQELGMTFFDLINHNRVEEAKKLLKANHADRKILAIAMEVGFGNKATFNRVFKRFAGCTPSEYKNQ